MTSRPYRFAVLLTALLGLAACSQQQAPAPAQTAPGTPAADSAPAAAPAPAQAAAQQPEPAAPPVPAAAPTPPQGPAPVAGTDYVEIPGGQPYEPANGKIEVVEVFGYTCPHCAHFEPLVEAWRARQPADVKFIALAAPFGGYWEPYAKAFFAAQALGVQERSHKAVFDAIHVQRTLPVQPLPSNEQIGAFYAQYGVDAKQFANTMASFAVGAKMKRAQQFIMRSGIDATPTLVVNGKYRITGKSFEDTLRIADHLVAQERAKLAGAAAGG